MTLLMPREVGIRELHDRLSHYIELVESGTELIVTKRGKQVARIASPEPNPLDDLIRRGLARPPLRPKRPASEIPRVAYRKRGAPPSEAVSEMRTERDDELAR